MPATRTETNRRSHSRRPKPGHIPRPKNAFMCYRSWFYENKPPPPTADGKKLNQQVLSKQVAITWNSMTPEEQAPFHEMAKQEKKAHELKYPSYSYSPGKLQAKASVAKRKRSARPRRRHSDEVSQDEQSSSDDREDIGSSPPTHRTLRGRRASDASSVSGTSAPPRASLSPPSSPTPSLCMSSSASEPDLDEKAKQANCDATPSGKYYIDQSLVVLPGQEELEPLLVSYDLERPAHLSNDVSVFGPMHDDWSMDEELFSPYYCNSDIVPYDTVYFSEEASEPFFTNSEVTPSFQWTPDPTPTVEEPSHEEEVQALTKAVDGDCPTPTPVPFLVVSASTITPSLQETSKGHTPPRPRESSHSPARDGAALSSDPDPGPLPIPPNLMNRIFETLIALKDGAD